MATVQIKLASVDITAHVIFATATFTSAVNGTVGSCKFRVRDDDRTMSPNAGDEIELIIDGDPVWTGYLVLTSRVYAFPAENVADAGLARWFDVEGSDLNTLFNKRIAFNQTTPTDNVVRFPYPPVTADSTAIAELVTNWLDLSGDSLDTSTHVETVADINVDQDAYPWSGSQTFGQAMFQIASLPAGVYFLDPSRNLVYTDVNTADAPFALSDQPTGTDAGYREMTLTSDGTSLVNDELAWGIGYGSQNPVFKRETDAASVALHGLWQDGRQANFVYKQATIDRIAQSVVYGSPSSQRGAKDDRVAVVVTTYVPGFLPAQKVDFTSNIFGFEDVIPIRKMEVTFDAPDAPKYVLTLSHAIDSPWGFVDQYLLNLTLPRITLPRLPALPLFPCSDGSTPLVTGVLDDFQRTVSGSWGTASDGQAWTTITGVPEVTGSQGILPPSTAVRSGIPDSASPLASGEFDLSMEWTLDVTASNAMILAVAFDATEAVWVELVTSGSNPIPISVSCSHVDLATGGFSAPINTDTGFIPLSEFVAGDTYILKLGMSLADNLARTKVYRVGDPEPGWQAAATLLGDIRSYITGASGVQVLVRNNFSGSSPSTAVDLLSYGCIPTSVPVPAVGNCGDPGDEITEFPTWVGGGVIKTRCSYQPNSPQVYRNGILQRINVDYVQTDSTAGTLTFDDDLTSTDAVEITYVSQGNPSS